MPLISSFQSPSVKLMAHAPPLVKVARMPATARYFQIVFAHFSLPDFDLCMAFPNHRQTSFRCMARAMCSACRMASATMVSVGGAARSKLAAVGDKHPSRRIDS